MAVLSLLPPSRPVAVAIHSPFLKLFYSHWLIYPCLLLIEPRRVLTGLLRHCNGLCNQYVGKSPR